MSVHLPESLLLASILAERCVRHQERHWIRMIGQRPPGNQSHHHKTQDCEPRGRAVLLGSLTYSSPPGHTFPIKSLALSACVSSDNSFLSVRQEPSFRPWKGSPFLQHFASEAPSHIVIKLLFIFFITLGNTWWLAWYTASVQDASFGWITCMKSKVINIFLITLFNFNIVLDLQRSCRGEQRILIYSTSSLL